MPNWCNNSLTVTGDEATLVKLAEAAAQGEFCATVLPIGEWDYGTAVETWGTKWDITDDQAEVADGQLTMNFDSAWSPPIGVYEALFEMEGITGVYASYFEPGMAFGGEWDDGDDRFVEDIAEEIKRGNPLARELDDQWSISEWYDDDDEDELLEWIEDGLEEKNKKVVDNGTD